MIKINILFISLFSFSFYILPAQQKIIIIHPSGDTKNLNRKLHKSYEQIQTHHFAEILNEVLHQEQFFSSTIISDTFHTTTVPFQTASLVNSSNTDLFLSIHFYKQIQQRPVIHIIHYVNNPLLDYAKHQQKTDIIPIHQAHYKSIHKTIHWGNILKKTLNQSMYQKLFDVQGLYGIPVKALEGITCPAFFLDIGLSEDEQWNIVIQPLVEGIKQLLYTN